MDSAAEVVPSAPRGYDPETTPLVLGLWPRGSMAGRLISAIIVVAVLVAACGANVGEPPAVAEEAAALNGGPLLGAVSSEPESGAAPPIPPPVSTPPETSVPVTVSDPSPPPTSEPVPVTVPVTVPDPEPPSPPPTSEPVPVTVPDPEPPSPPPTSEPAAPPPAPAPPPPSPPPPPAEAPSWQPVTILVARDDVNGVIPVYDAPGGDRLSFTDGEVWSYTFRGNRLVVRVLQGAQGDEWAQVELPVRPSGSRGWVRAENFTWSTVNHHILVDVSARSVALYEGDNLITSTRAIVGKSATPTPALRGFIVEKLPNHSQQNASVVLGDWILMLSFFSEALTSFGGGLPRIALHGTHIPERVGEALSNGCIRIPNNIIETIARRVPLGTVVNVVA